MNILSKLHIANHLDVGELMEDLNCDVSFYIPVLKNGVKFVSVKGKGIPIYESVVCTWGIMLAVLIICLILVRNLKVEKPGRKQVVLEVCVKWLHDFFEDILGPRGKEYIPYLASVIVYIGIANLLGILGIKSPTKDLNITAALALMSIVLIQVSGIRAKGTKGWIKSFAEPTPVVTPINILELFIKPLSLCMRLFGNVLGSFIIMEMIKIVVPYVVPAFLCCYFDIFDGLIQAYVFVFLTGLFMKEAME